MTSKYVINVPEQTHIVIKITQRLTGQVFIIFQSRTNLLRMPESRCVNYNPRKNAVVQIK